MKNKLTKQDHIKCLLWFSKRESFLEEEINEYWEYQANGGKKIIDNPLLWAQRWKEWYLASVAEGMIERWSLHYGWAHELDEIIEDYEKEEIEVMIRALHAMHDKATKVGIIAFYETFSHPKKGHLQKCIKRHFDTEPKHWWESPMGKREIDINPFVREQYENEIAKIHALKKI